MRRYLFSLIIIILLSACGPSKLEIEQTVAVEVVARVVATIEQLPTGTALPSLTPLPTYTARPSLTPAATFTAVPTYTPQPSYTPAATLTPRPTWTHTPTATPTETATPIPVVVNPAPLATGISVPNLLIVKSRLRALADTIDWKFKTDPVTGSTSSASMTVVCDEMIAAHGQLSAVLIPPPTSGSSNQQNAYAHYQNAVTLFLAEIDGWLTGCLPGETGNLTAPARSTMIIARNEALGLLDQAITLLEGGD